MVSFSPSTISPLEIINVSFSIKPLLGDILLSDSSNAFIDNDSLKLRFGEIKSNTTDIISDLYVSVSYSRILLFTNKSKLSGLIRRSKSVNLICLLSKRIEII